MTDFDSVTVSDFQITAGTGTTPTVAVVSGRGRDRPVALCVDKSYLSVVAHRLMSALAQVDPIRALEIVARQHELLSGSRPSPPIAQRATDSVSSAQEGVAMPADPAPGQAVARVDGGGGGLDEEMVRRAKQFQDQCKRAGLSDPVTAALIQAALTMASHADRSGDPGHAPPYQIRIAVPEVGDREVAIDVDLEDRVVLVAPQDGAVINGGLVLRDGDAARLGGAIRAAGMFLSSSPAPSSTAH
jgi:hypothetical protein